MTKKRQLAYTALLITAVIWGLAPPIIKYTLGFISPINFLFYRFLLASIILLIPLALKLKKERPSRQKLLRYIGLGFLGTPLTLYLLFSGLEKTTAIDTSIIWVMAPIMVVLGGAFFLKEKVTKKERIGVAVALAGTIVTILQPFLESAANFDQNIVGNTLVFAGTCIWAGFTLLSKKHKNLEPFTLAAISFFVGALVLSPIFTYTNVSFNLHPQAIPGILYMAFFGSIIAYFTYIYGVSKIEASEATIFTYLQPLFAVPLAALWLGEKITLPFILGASLIATGVFIAEKR